MGKRRCGAPRRQPINADQVYRPADLPAVTGLSWKYLKGEVVAGRLRADRRANMVLVRGAWLLDWLERRPGSLPPQG